MGQYVTPRPATSARQTFFSFRSFFGPGNSKSFSRHMLFRGSRRHWHESRSIFSALLAGCAALNLAFILLIHPVTQFKLLKKVYETSIFQVIIFVTSTFVLFIYQHA